MIPSLSTSMRQVARFSRETSLVLSGLNEVDLVRVGPDESRVTVLRGAYRPTMALHPGPVPDLVMFNDGNQLVLIARDGDIDVWAHSPQGHRIVEVYCADAKMGVLAALGDNALGTGGARTRREALDAFRHERIKVTSQWMTKSDTTMTLLPGNIRAAAVLSPEELIVVDAVDGTVILTDLLGRPKHLVDRERWDSLSVYNQAAVLSFGSGYPHFGSSDALILQPLTGRRFWLREAGANARWCSASRIVAQPSEAALALYDAQSGQMIERCEFAAHQRAEWPHGVTKSHSGIALDTGTRSPVPSADGEWLIWWWNIRHSQTSVRGATLIDTVAREYRHERGVLSAAFFC